MLFTVKSRKTAAKLKRKLQRNQPRVIENLERRDLMAADPMVFDGNSVTWAAYRDQTSSEWSDIFAKRRDDYIPVDIDITEVSGSARISGIWHKNTEDRDWALWRNMSSESFGTKWQQYKDQGYRLVDQESYTLGGTRYYAGIWIKNEEGYAWASRRNMTSAQRQAFFDQYKDDYVPIDVDAYSMNGSMRYSVVFVENAKNFAWQSRTGLSSTQFSDLFNSLKGTHRVHDIESYTEGGQQKYQVVWLKNTNGRAWASRRDLSATQYWNDYNSYADQGYRLVDVERYQSGGNWRYAAVWRQNSERMNWSHRSAVDKIIKDAIEDFDIPGVGVTIYQNGSVRYRRGFGYQDINDGLQYSSRTINRLASVSKAVAGVLALDLDEKGLLNIDSKSSSYIKSYNGNSMPSKHTHTLRQLLSNRAGMGHYDEWGTPSGSYSTALAATAALWNKTLVDKPGKKYHYSTHGYTFLGAAMEGALGKSITQIVKQYVTDAYKLDTLKVENRSVSNSYRAALYSSSNKELSADNSSWKILGGGLEGSAYDLARFGNMVLNGTILTSASRTDMWTAPAPTSKKYGLGWDFGTRNDTQWVGKSGAQRGSNTYLLMFPEKGIVISVLTNRQEGHKASSIANAIGDRLTKSSSSARSASATNMFMWSYIETPPIIVPTTDAATPTAFNTGAAASSSVVSGGTLSAAQSMGMTHPAKFQLPTVIADEVDDEQVADPSDLTDVALAGWDDWRA